MAGLTVEVQRRVPAPIERVFELVADPAEMARWNPTFDHIEWLHGATESEPGARFQVHNVDARFDWSFDECVVIEHDAPRLFAFARVVGTRDAAFHRFVLQDDGDATLVTITYEQWWEPLVERLRALFVDREADARRALEAALDGLERAATG